MSIDLSLPWQVIHGDCLDVMRSLPDGCVDAVVTDPPYGIDLQPQRGLTLAIAGDKPHEARPLWEGLAREAAQEGYRFLGIEREASYVEVARRRIADAAAQGNLFAEVG